MVDRPKSIGQAHRMLIQMEGRIEQLEVGLTTISKMWYDHEYDNSLSCAVVVAKKVLESAGDTCPNCGGDADNGYDRSYPPNPYFCTKCQ